MAHAVPRYLFWVIGPRGPVRTRPLRTVGTLIRVRAVADVPGVAEPVARAGVRAGAEALPGFDDNADEEEELAHRSSGAALKALYRGCPSWLSSLAVCHDHCASFVTSFDGFAWHRAQHRPSAEASGSPG